MLYPAVAGEVNPVDFIAIEFIRIFEPVVYSTICDNKDMFVGYIDRSNRNMDPEKTFHGSWIGQVQAPKQAEIKALITRLFPRLESVWSNVSYSSSSLSGWRKEQRICSPDLFDIYFQYGVPKDSLRRSELNKFIVTAADPEEAISILTSASSIKRPDGVSKATEYLDRLRDLDSQVQPESAKGILIALFDIGDQLLSRSDEGIGLLSVPNRLRLIWTVNHLFKLIPDQSRTELLKSLISTGKSLCLVVQVVGEIEKFIEKSKDDVDFPFARIDRAGLAELTKIVTDRFSRISVSDILTIPELIYVIHKWSAWAGNQAVADRLSPLLLSEELFPILLEKHLTWGTRQTSNEVAIQRVPHLNPKHFEPFADIYSLESQVMQMLNRHELTQDQKIAGEQYLKSMERIKQGKDPGGFFSDD